MDLKDVKFDGSTLYHCRKSARDCVIVASSVIDGACLVAMDYGDEHFGDAWITEACFLSPVPSAALLDLQKALAFYDANNLSPESERTAVGRVDWDWVLKAARNAVTKYSNEGG